MHIDPNDPSHVETDFFQNPIDGAQDRAGFLPYVSELRSALGKVGSYEAREIRIVVVNDDLTERCV